MWRSLTALVALGVVGCSSPPASGPLLSPPANGYQIEIGPFEVPPASAGLTDPGVVQGEVQLCRTLKLPNDEPVAIDRLQVAMNQGSHHFIIFRSPQDFPDQVFPCWGTVNFDDWEFVIDVNRTGGNDWQLKDGQAFIMQPHQQLMIQAHFVNATTVQAPLGGRVTTNLYRTDMAQVQHQLHGLFAVNTALYNLDPRGIPPGASYTTPTRTCTFSQTAHVTAMTGHFHKRGTKFDVHLIQEINRGTILGTMSTDLGQIYESDNWDSPPFKLYEPAQLVASLHNAIGFQCSYFNDTANFVGWGGHADVQEHCNLFLQYYDDEATEPLRCMEGSGGW